VKPWIEPAEAELDVASARRRCREDRARASTLLPPRCHQPGRRPRLAADASAHRWRRCHPPALTLPGYVCQVHPATSRKRVLERTSRGSRPVAACAR
jgi:hypothetical protein